MRQFEGHLDFISLRGNRYARSATLRGIKEERLGTFFTLTKKTARRSLDVTGCFFKRQFERISRQLLG